MSSHQYIIHGKHTLFFSDVTNIAGLHIKVNTSKEKVINLHIKDRKTIQFKAFTKGLFYTNINDPTMINNPTNAPLNDYSYLSTVKQNSDFY